MYVNLFKLFPRAHTSVLMHTKRCNQAWIIPGLLSCFPYCSLRVMHKAFWLTKNYSVSKDFLHNSQYISVQYTQTFAEVKRGFAEAAADIRWASNHQANMRKQYNCRTRQQRTEKRKNTQLLWDCGAVCNCNGWARVHVFLIHKATLLLFL